MHYSPKVRALAAMSVLVAFYLVGAFGSWDINAGHWDVAARWCIVFLAAVVAAMVAGLPEA